ncbi:MAG TPA: GMC family oxidoreductase [Actinomycetales bacterium]|nr:GMC family oxidoreductase [Actinomycetales bacterium]
MTEQVEYVENVVVGSGFGGSVAAFRLAEAGREVCVLERGRAFGPGDFARDPWQGASAFWDPSEGRHGVFDVWSFRGLDAVVSAGLGGGSLIYANVLIRKPPEWFVKYQPFGGGYEAWPISREDLEPHYDAVEKMLDAQRFPEGAPGFESVLKTAAMRDAARALDRARDFELPKLAVTFRPEPGKDFGVGLPIVEGSYPNYHKKDRVTCTLCGQCDLGCNFGAKNTLDHTYLSAAKNTDNADIRVRTEVRRIAKAGDGYLVSYVVHDEEHGDGRPHPTRALEERRIRCRRLFLAAGSLGSTYLLLRNRDELPGLSTSALGTRFSGNGDYLAVLKGARRPLHASVGPVITSALRTPDSVETRSGSTRGFYVQDAGYPMVLNWLVEARYGLPFRLLRFSVRRAWAQISRNPKSELSSALAQVLGDGATAASSTPLLGMGRDVPDGVMRLNRRQFLAIDTNSRSSKAYYAGVREQMQALAEVLGAELKDGFWTTLHRSVTVHPVGGAPMGTTIQEAVCDHLGEVFGLDNLFVCDGAVMPGPVGPNPSLTIAAFSDRMVEAVLNDRTRSPMRSRQLS